MRQSRTRALPLRSGYAVGMAIRWAAIAAVIAMCGCGSDPVRGAADAGDDGGPRYADCSGCIPQLCSAAGDRTCTFRTGAICPASCVAMCPPEDGGVSLLAGCDGDRRACNIAGTWFTGAVRCKSQSAPW